MVVRRIGEKGHEAEAGHGLFIEAGDEFTAHAVPGIIARFKNCHGHIRAPQGRAECEAGEAAADDFDGEFHEQAVEKLC
jgi:hypothetical protein